LILFHQNVLKKKQVPLIFVWAYPTGNIHIHNFFKMVAFLTNFHITNCTTVSSLSNMTCYNTNWTNTVIHGPQISATRDHSVLEMLTDCSNTCS